MFTGIVSKLGFINQINSSKLSKKIIVKCNNFLTSKDIGTSIAVNGACLTLRKFKKLKNSNFLFFDISHETLRLTNLKNLKVSSIVNLEKSLSYGDKIAGHFVLGHIDTTSSIIKIQELNNSWNFYLKVKKGYLKFLFKKGSICINGVSLTVNEIKKDIIILTIIPFTFNNTNLKFLKTNDRVNIEFDIISKYLVSS